MIPTLPLSQQDAPQKSAIKPSPQKEESKPFTPSLKSKSPDHYSAEKKTVKPALSPAMQLRDALDFWDVQTLSSILKSHPECVNEIDPETGQSALMTAVQKAQLEILSHLLACKNTDINLKNSEGLTALHIAVKNKRERSFDALLAAGAVANTYSLQHRTPLMDATENGNFHMTCALLNKGADKFILYQDDAGKTAAYAAAAGGNCEVINLLARHGANFNTPNHDGLTPLIIAAYYGNTAAVKALLKLGCPFFQLSANGLSALNAACKAGRIETIKLLIEKGAHKKKTAVDPVFSAACTNQSAVIRMLHAAGADIDIPDQAGDTPLIAAAYLGKTEAVYHLLQCKADPQHRNISKNNALAAAIEGNQADAIYLLLGAEREKIIIQARQLKKMVDIASTLQDGRILDLIGLRKFFNAEGTEIMIDPSWIHLPDQD